MLIHLHHALGDGLGLLFATSPLMGVKEGHPLAQIPLPRAVLPDFARKPAEREERAATGGRSGSESDCKVRCRSRSRSGSKCDG